MYAHGYGSSRNGYPPEDLPPGPYQEQSTMMQGRYQDPPPHLHQYPPQYDSSPFNPHNSHYPPDQRQNFHHPPAQGSSFWAHDGPRPGAPPPPFESFYPHPPQHEFGLYPPRPPPHSAPYPPHYVPDTSSSFGEHGPPSAMHQHGQTHPHTYSFGELSHSSSEFVHASSFGEHGFSPSVYEHAHHSFRQSPALHHSSSVPHHTASDKGDKPLILEREFVVPVEISSPVDVELPKGQLVRIFCKYSRSFNLAVKDNKLMMLEADTEDEFQQWIRDDKYSIRVRDINGHPAFMLINKGSKKVLKHGKGKLEDVQLTNYTPELQDDDLFWTESQDFGEGYKTVRMASNTLLNLSVACGNKIENGSAIILDSWHKKDSQLWKIFPL